MKCPNCGENMKSKLNFCGFCGTNLRTGEKAADNEPKKTSSKPVFNAAPEPNLPPLKVEQEFNPPPLKAEQEEVKHSVPVQSSLPTMVQAPEEPEVQKVEPAVFTLPKESVKTDFKPEAPETVIESTAPATEFLKQPEAVQSQNGKPAEAKHIPETADKKPGASSLADLIKQKAETQSTHDSAAPETEKPAEEKNDKHEKSLFAALVENPEKADEIKKEAGVLNAEPIPQVAPTEPEAPPVSEKRKVKVLDVVGQNKTTAEQKLKFLELSVECEYINDDSPKGTVLKQSIPFNTDVEIETTIILTVSVGTWCRWTAEPLIIDPEDTKYVIETKDQYRVRTRTRDIDYKESNTEAEMTGYTLYDTQKVYSEWVNDVCFVSEKRALNDLCDICKKQLGFKYCGWFYNGTDAKKRGTSFATPKLAVFFNKDTVESNWSYDEIIEHKDISPNVVGWKPAEDNVDTTPAGDSITNNVFISTYEMAGKAFAMKFGTINGEWFKYKTRKLEKVTYFFQKEIISEWSEWSEWEDREITGKSDLKEIEKQTVSRYRRKSTAELKTAE